LLAFATGTDLDNLAAFYGIARKENESDSRAWIISNLFGSGVKDGSDTWRDHRHFNVPWEKCSEFTPILEATE
jgi:hypothetical protein